MFDANISHRNRWNKVQRGGNWGRQNRWKRVQKGRGLELWALTLPQIEQNYHFVQLTVYLQNLLFQVPVLKISART
jgi:hypothetical protein